MKSDKLQILCTYLDHYDQADSGMLSQLQGYLRRPQYMWDQGVIIRFAYWQDATNFPIQTEKSVFIAPVLLRNFGAEIGLILVTDFRSIESIAKELQNIGYGFSTLSEPLENERFDKNSVMEMLYDWGWSGLGEPPSWYDKNHT